MRLDLTRSAAFVLAGGALSLCGCDQSEGQADKQIRANLRDAHAVLTVGGDDTSAIQSLTAAAAVTGGSPAMRAVAKSALARTELTNAYRLIGQVDELELQLSRAGWEIAQLAQQVRASGTEATGYKQFDPKPATDAIATKVGEARGSADKGEWIVKGDQTSLPTLTAVNQQVTKTEGDIAQLLDQSKNLETDRDKILTDAAAAASQSETLKGQESVEVYKKASDLRKQAAEKSIEIDKLAIQIARQQANLAVAQAQQGVLTAAIAQLQQHSAALDKGWQQVDADVAGQQAFATKVLGTEGGDAAADNIFAKAAEMEKLVKQVADLRGQAQLSADNAAKYYEDAYTAADENRRLTQALISDPKNQSRPEVAAWKDLIDAVSPLNYKFLGAAAQRAAGSLHGSEAASLTRRIQLHETVALAVASIGKQVPAELSTDLTKPRDAALSTADEAYKTSEALLGDVIDGQASEDLQTSARISRALTLYDWSLIEGLAGNDKGAKEHLDAAISDRSAASEHNVILPALPTAIAPAPSTTAPSSAPAAATPTNG